jgi:hypothetical protein
MKKGLDIKIEGLECPGIITIESLITYPPLEEVIRAYKKGLGVEVGYLATRINEGVIKEVDYHTLTLHRVLEVKCNTKRGKYSFRGHNEFVSRSSSFGQCIARTKYLGYKVVVRKGGAYMTLASSRP